MTIYLTVTNDLSYDQRMTRICTSLAGAGYTVVLVGRKMQGSVSLTHSDYEQKRLSCWFNKGKFFYAEYNIRLFFFLLFKKMDCICAIDLDTILPCLFISKLKKTKRVYDAHELFCEMKEIVTRPAIQKVWRKVERYAVPQFKNGYTVNQPIAGEFNRMYGVNYGVIKNVPPLTSSNTVQKKERYIIYQGAVNEARCFESLIPAMKEVECTLVICGDGNFMEQAKQLAKENGVENKVIFKGNVAPGELKSITEQAYIGINLVENTGLSNYLSLANKFFDYIHAGIPQLSPAYPAYKEVNDKEQVAVLLTDMSIKNIAQQLNNLLSNELLHQKLAANCIKAKAIYNWQHEEKILLYIYRRMLG